MGKNRWRRLTACKGLRKRQRMSEVGEEICMAQEEDNTKGNASLVRFQNDVRDEDVMESPETKIGDRSFIESGRTDNSLCPDDELTAKISQSNPKQLEKIVSVRPGITLPTSNQESKPGVIFVFEKASLVLAKIKKTYQIIDPDYHAGFMQKHNIDRRDYRPDIIHDVLKRLLGSRLNLSGGIQAVCVKTIQGHLIKIEPTIRVPDTLQSFCAMITQLLQKLHIKGSGKSRGRKLLQLIQNPVTDYFPVGSLKIGLSSTSPKAVKLWKYFDTVSNDRPLVFVIGAMAHGKIDADYTDEFIAVSGIPLSASICVRRICNALEKQRKIL